MKKRLLALACVLALLTGCRNILNTDVSPSPAPAQSGGEALTQEEIDRVNEAFTPTREENGTVYATAISCFFTSRYDGPEELELEEFLRYFPDGTALGEEDAEEFAALAALPDFPLSAEGKTPEDLPVPVWRITEEALDKVLAQYADVTSGELKNTDGVLYLEEYHAYYNFTSDFGPGSFTCVGGEWDENGARLWSRTREDGTRDVLKLRCEDDRYFIQAFTTEDGETLLQVLTALEGEDIGHVSWTGTGEGPTEQELADRVRSAMERTLDHEVLTMNGSDTDVVWSLDFYLGEKGQDAWSGEDAVHLFIGLEENIVEIFGGTNLPSGRIWVEDEALYQLIRTQNDAPAGEIDQEAYAAYREGVEAYLGLPHPDLEGVTASWTLTGFQEVAARPELDAKVYEVQVVLTVDPPERAPHLLAGGAYVDSALRIHGSLWANLLVTAGGRSLGFKSWEWLNMDGGLEQYDTAQALTADVHRSGEMIWSWDKEVVSDAPGGALIRYTALDEDGVLQTKLEVASAAEEHDLDGGGDVEIVVYLTGDHAGIGIYDLAHGELVYLDVNETLGCRASNYAGNIGNIQREYGSCVEAFFTDPDGSQRIEIYRYTPDRTLEYVCPLEEAMLK